MKAVIYARVSSKDQEDGHSLDAQIQSGFKYAIEKDFNVLEQFKIVESSTANGRPEFARMVQFVKKQSGKTAIICYCVDRLQRDFDEQYVELQKLIKLDKAEIHYTQNGFVEHKHMDSSQKFKKNLDVLLANDYRNKISDNVRRSIKKKLEEGTICGDSPVGYLNKKRVHAKKEKREAVEVYIDPIRGPLIRQLFEMYSTGDYSMAEARSLITEAGLRSKKNCKMSKSQIERTLTNPFYYGYMEAEGMLYKHVYEPLVSKELFDQCQDVRFGRKKTKYKRTDKDFIFKALIKCEHCGCSYSSYTRPKMTKKYGQREYVYLKPTKSKGECEHCVEVGEHILLDQLANNLKAMQIPEEYLQAIKDSVKDNLEKESKKHKEKLKNFHAQYEDIDATLKDLRHQRYVSKDLPEDDYIELKTELEVKKGNIKKEIELLESDDAEFEVTVSTILDIASRAYEVFKSSKQDKKRAILKLLFSNFFLSGKTLVFTVVKPFDEVLKCGERPIWLPIARTLRTKRREDVMGFGVYASEVRLIA